MLHPRPVDHAADASSRSTDLRRRFRLRYKGPMSGHAQLFVAPIRDGRIEAYHLPGGPGRPLLVLGGVEAGFRTLRGTEQVLARRWAGRRVRRPVVVVGRPLPDEGVDPARLMHPRVAADATATALRSVALDSPFAIEAESGGGRIGLWLAVDQPDLVARLALASVASETPPGSAMADRLGLWIALAEAEQWDELFGGFAVQMRPTGGPGAPAFETAARLQPRPSTPGRFIGELKATLDPSSWVTDRLGEIRVPTLVLAGGRDQVVPPEVTRQVADAIPDARFELDPGSGHTVRSSFSGYDDLVEAFLAEGD